MQPQLVVALDLPTAKQALELAARLQPVTPWMKVGLELFCATGPAIVGELKKNGCKVFLDLKFHDIPNTVARAVRTALASGADICDIHMSGGSKMARAAADVIREARADGADCLIFGVTVLTSTSAAELGCSPMEKVLEYAVTAKESGLDGVVCSGWEATAVKERCGNNFMCLCPGIRPRGAALDDQSRVLTPDEAIRAGADFIVVGRPITGAADPAQAAAGILKTIRET